MCVQMHVKYFCELLKLLAYFQYMPSLNTLILQFFLASHLGCI